MVKVEHLTKYYGDFLAIRDLSFEIGAGRVYGFLGPNGAGKSTTMNILTGCLSPSSGKVLIDGHDILEEPREAKKLIGYLPEHPPLYLSETPLEYLRFVGEAKGLSGEALRKEIETVIEETGLSEVRNRLISALSKGFRQRVGIAQALLGNPKLIILDEPTVGLDPIQIIEIRDLIKKLGETHTVIFSSHILSEVQTICEQVLIISGGELAAFDTPENLEKMQKSRTAVLLTVLSGQEEAEDVLSTLFDTEDAPQDENTAPDLEVTECSDDSVSFRIAAKDRDPRELCRDLFFAFSDRKLPIVEMRVDRANLEDIFVELTEENNADAEMPEPREEKSGSPGGNAGHPEKETEESGVIEE